MTATVIEGTLVEAKVKRAAPQLSMFDTLKFALRDGGSHELRNAVASGDVVRHLVPGARGRFYLFSAIDMRGVYGLKLEDGTAASDYAGKGNRRIFWLALIVGLAAMLFFPLVTGTVRLIPLVPLVIGAFGLFLTSKTEAESRNLFVGE